MGVPKLFISYSWSNPDHEQWVLDLATELRESGVDVILDKWDLKEGHDAVAFMEQMATDPNIGKVALICDEVYAAKADGRAGGVGTETQIISREVYENQSQDKFVAIVSQKDQDGKAYLPTYYKSRIYIDLSEPDAYSDNFERLLRWIFDKPLYVKPDLGKKPSFLEEGDHVSLGTSAKFKRCIESIKNQKSYSFGAFDEYCSTFVENFERFRISSFEGNYDDEMLKNIEEFLPSRNEFIQMLIAIAQYSPTEQFAHRLHRFFESLIPYMDRPPVVTQWNERDFDNFKFLVHELFLYSLAVFLKHERFSVVSYLLQQPYYIPGNSEYGRDATVSFITFRRYAESLEHRNKRLGLRRLSLRADLLKERCAGVGIDFRYIMQADFVAFIKGELDAEDDFNRWWPETLLYVGHFNGQFEVFARAISKKYFDQMKVILGIEGKEDLKQILSLYRDGSRRLPRWEMNGFNPVTLMGYDNLATKV